MCAIDTEKLLVQAVCEVPQVAFMQYILCYVIYERLL